MPPDPSRHASHALLCGICISYACCCSTGPLQIWWLRPCGGPLIFKKKFCGKQSHLVTPTLMITTCTSKTCENTALYGHCYSQWWNINVSLKDTQKRQDFDSLLLFFSDLKYCGLDWEVQEIFAFAKETERGTVKICAHMCTCMYKMYC